MPRKILEHEYGITPPSIELQKKIGGPLTPLGNSQAEQVQKALEQLSESMTDWIRADLDKLNDARHAFIANDQSKDCIDNLHRAAHDLKGLGQTYGFPTVSIIADTLCKAIAQAQASEAGTVPRDLVNAHVDALRAVVNLNLRDTDSKPAQELLGGLLSLVEKKIA